jgi:hypothetical protein
VIYLFLAGLLGAQAHATEATVSAAAGLDYLTANPWVGLDLSFHPEREEGWEAVGKVTPSWGLKDDTVLMLTEVGAVRTIPTEQATVRVGLVGRGVSYMGHYALPIQPGGIPREGGRPQWGVVPGGYALLEFEMGEISPLSVGFHAGAGSAAGDYACGEESNPNYCLYWDPAFIGGFIARYQHKSGFVLDARFGPSARLALGWAFGKKD